MIEKGAYISGAFFYVFKPKQINGNADRVVFKNQVNYVDL
jgi:hypothetical protein